MSENKYEKAIIPAIMAALAVFLSVVKRNKVFHNLAKDLIARLLNSHKQNRPIKKYNRKRYEIYCTKSKGPFIEG